jgi:hypothetical protein
MSQPSIRSFFKSISAEDFLVQASDEAPRIPITGRQNQVSKSEERSTNNVQETNWRPIIQGRRKSEKKLHCAGGMH